MTYNSGMERPLVRWTVGPCSQAGIQILNESVRTFAQVYPEFERVVCFNNMDYSLIEHISPFAELKLQSADMAPVPLSGPSDDPEEAIGCGWKLAPPRLREDGYELFLDNDILIRKRLPSLDAWLSQSVPIISEGLTRRRMFGAFDSYILPDIRACAGLFGLPPGFNFDEKIRYYWNFFGKPLGGYDEQGLTTAIVTNTHGWMMLPLSELHISEDVAMFPLETPAAIHFVAANRKPWHRGWKAYRAQAVFRL